MRVHHSLLATGAAAILLGADAQSQVGPLDYQSNWQPMSNSLSAAFSGPALFSSLAPGAVGGAIRRCYGIDSTQGGRNQSTGRYETTWIKVSQGWGPSSAVPGVNVGLVSVQSATDGDPGADICLSPFAKSSQGSGGHQVSAMAVLGVQPGTTAGAFPQVWEVAFQWITTSVGSPSILGTDASGRPLLVNVIYEIQSPLNSALSPQYYIASTTELTGLDPAAPGGFANGNALLGTSVYGVPPHVSGAISHSRVIAAGPGGLVAAPMPALLQTLPGRVELGGHVAFRSPALWALNDGNAGAGGADWSVGSAPVSVIDLRLLDVLAGAQTNRLLSWSGVPAMAFDPHIVFNQAFFLWSTTPASGMLQTPMSWDDLGGAVQPQAGSIDLGTVATSREGDQTVPANRDGLMNALLPRTAYTLGTRFTPAEDPFLDGFSPGGDSQLWEGMFDPVISGLSTLGRGPLPIVGAPAPNLVGVKLGVAALGLQIDLSIDHKLRVTELGNALTINLQD